MDVQALAVVPDRNAPSATPLADAIVSDGSGWGTNSLTGDAAEREQACDLRPNTAPVAATKFVVKKENETVASFTTDAEGRFRISRPPGHYIVAREDAGRIGRWRFEIDVVAGEMKKVEWAADSGMR